ncbi:MAG: GNAT family N-acetyltransferase [Nitrososphaerota archaeon]|nr:GNAT family N-acetyltransferase [Nitrososphaerota archaeon]
MPGAPLTTKEMSKGTWEDFQRLFEKPGEWGACWCVYYQRASPPPSAGMSLQQRADRNRKDKKSLVDSGDAHGIIVYAGKEPVGWCQYGVSHEIPRIDATRRYRRLSPDYGGERVWRISCFCTDRKHRGKGVAGVALEGALRSIKKKGGGVVEAYPATRRGALAAWFGTVSMFEKQGFRVAAPFGRSNVLMTKTV